ncbi:hypothetical protein EMIHUDRAFT_459830 [Emiliania huxleyi CCMP1516]|uniref:Uncharacterized protein n=2 Tax=Emiliania huxleyi TaxID=2903 RepID=A0A0D3IH44_EMIH1|nr:hypothetical protein EMIHUDRAFT_459830 [Emiliania huxleyi CCMP1516]EOD10579.1 hypothetical protein EMIHUDRAFT_459830 [Emiliania huxleyi CCMP1516]|eukprot:XP_005763008.1 hypothetical protein EMIHUDRAFT_459830 [Emiliania huxleyi CCMP1516]
MDFGNYGTPRGSPASELYATEIHELHSRCRFRYEPLRSAFPSLTVSHYTDTDTYDRFDGVDLTPHNHRKYQPGSGWALGLQPRTSDREPQGALCEAVADGGATWAILRVGPFNSTGGYDWWQFAAHDALNLSRRLEGGRTLALHSHYVVGVRAEDGGVLGYPPLHMHHLHLVPSKPWLRYQWPMTGASWQQWLARAREVQGFSSYVPNYFALDMEGEVNDARAAGSPPLAWYLEVGVGFEEAPDHLSLVPSHQSTYENYYWVPTDGKHVHWYEGEMPSSGQLVRMKHHAHMSLLRRAYFVAGTAEELGLHKLLPRDKFGEQLPLKWPQAGHSWRWPSSIPIVDLDKLETLLLKRIDRLPGGRSRIICTLDAAREEAGGYPGYVWDRAGKSVCTPWTFRRGDPFLSVALLEWHGGRLGPWANESAPLPELLPMHTQWNLLFAAADGASHYFMYPAFLASRALPLVERALVPQEQAATQAIFREMLLVQNWRVVVPLNGPLGVRAQHFAHAVRRAPPRLLAAAGLVGAMLLWRCARRARRIKYHAI